MALSRNVEAMGLCLMESSFQDPEHTLFLSLSIINAHLMSYMKILFFKPSFQENQLCNSFIMQISMFGKLV